MKLLEAIEEYLDPALRMMRRSPKSRDLDGRNKYDYLSLPREKLISLLIEIYQALLCSESYETPRKTAVVGTHKGGSSRTVEIDPWLLGLLGIIAKLAYGPALAKATTRPQFAYGFKPTTNEYKHVLTPSRKGLKFIPSPHLGQLAYLRIPYPFVISIDVKKYFQSIDQEDLFKVLANHIDDPEGLLVLKRLTAAGTERGLVQGSTPSPLLADMYLGQSDNWCKRLGIIIVRYADDIRILAATEEDCRVALLYVEAILAEDFGLNVHIDNTVYGPGDLVPFCGAMIGINTVQPNADDFAAIDKAIRTNDYGTAISLLTGLQHGEHRQIVANAIASLKQKDNNLSSYAKLLSCLDARIPSIHADTIADVTEPVVVPKVEKPVPVTTIPYLPSLGMGVSNRRYCPTVDIEVDGKSLTPADAGRHPALQTRTSGPMEANPLHGLPGPRNQPGIEVPASLWPSFNGKAQRLPDRVPNITVIVPEEEVYSSALRSCYGWANKSLKRGGTLILRFQNAAYAATALEQLPNYFSYDGEVMDHDYSIEFRQAA